MFTIMAESNQPVFMKYFDRITKDLLDIASSKSAVKGSAMKTLGRLSSIIDICNKNLQDRCIQSSPNFSQNLIK